MTPLTHVLTASGRLVDLGAPQPAQIAIRDIASHLSKLAYSTQTPLFYSCAQHAVVCARLMGARPPIEQAFTFLENAHEAYCGRVSGSVRHTLPLALTHELAALEARLGRAIRISLGLPLLTPHAIQAKVWEVNARAKATVWRDLMPIDASGHEHKAAPASWHIKPWPWPKAEEKYLETWTTLAAAGVTDVRATAGA